LIPAPLGEMGNQGDIMPIQSNSSYSAVGIVPDVPVRPTIEGIGAGRDEVVEKPVRGIGDGEMSGVN